MMAVEILDQAMLRIAPADRAAEQLGSGYGGPNGPTEGPIWFHEGGYLLFQRHPRQQALQVGKIWKA